MLRIGGLFTSLLALMPLYMRAFKVLQPNRGTLRLYGNDVRDRFPTVSLDELLKDVIDRPCTHPPRPANLRNTYYGLRHGESEANIMGVISSDPIKGAQTHGLTGTGVRQAQKSADCVMNTIGLHNLDKVVFLSSNYKRARETAYECMDAICKHFYDILYPYREAKEGEIDDVTVARLDRSKAILEYVASRQLIARDELRERSFGELDGTVLINYNRVWPVDLRDAYNTRYKVESVHQVVQRVAGLVDSLESEFEGKHIIMASHADTLQIFQTYMNCSDPRKFSQYRFKNGEVSYPGAISWEYTDYAGVAAEHGVSARAGAIDIQIREC